MKLSKIAAVIVLATASLTGCNEPTSSEKPPSAQLIGEYNNRLDIYKQVTLSTDLSHLSTNQKKMIALLIEASDIIDELFWLQAFGENKNDFLASIEDKKIKKDLTFEKMIELRIAKKGDLIKVLGRGKIDVPVNVAAHKFSASAEKLIEKAGGKITKI